MNGWRKIEHCKHCFNFFWRLTENHKGLFLYQWKKNFANFLNDCWISLFFSATAGLKYGNMDEFTIFSAANCWNLQFYSRPVDKIHFLFCNWLMKVMIFRLTDRQNLWFFHTIVWRNSQFFSAFDEIWNFSPQLINEIRDFFHSWLIKFTIFVCERFTKFTVFFCLWPMKFVVLFHEQLMQFADISMNVSRNSQWGNS